MHEARFQTAMSQRIRVSSNFCFNRCMLQNENRPVHMLQAEHSHIFREPPVSFRAWYSAEPKLEALRSKPSGVLSPCLYSVV